MLWLRQVDGPTLLRCDDSLLLQCGLSSPKGRLQLAQALSRLEARHLRKPGSETLAANALDRALELIQPRRSSPAGPAGDAVVLGTPAAVALRAHCYQRLGWLSERGVGGAEGMSEAERAAQTERRLVQALHENERHLQSLHRTQTTSGKRRSRQRPATHHGGVVESLSTLAAHYRGCGRVGEAKPLLARALAMVEERYRGQGPNNQLVYAIDQLAEVKFLLGEVTEAHDLFARSAALWALLWKAGRGRGRGRGGGSGAAASQPERAASGAAASFHELTAPSGTMVLPQEPLVLRRGREIAARGAGDGGGGGRERGDGAGGRAGATYKSVKSELVVTFGEAAVAALKKPLIEGLREAGISVRTRRKPTTPQSNGARRGGGRGGAQRNGAAHASPGNAQEKGRVPGKLQELRAARGLVDVSLVSSEDEAPPAAVFAAAAAAAATASAPKGASPKHAAARAAAAAAAAMDPAARTASEAR